MKIEPSGVIFVDVCHIQTDKCVAKQPAPVTAVWGTPGRLQINVCRPCLEEQVRTGEWEIQGSRIKSRADVVVYSPNRKRQLVVEVQSNPSYKKPAVEWAKQIRRNLLVHAGVPGAPYFLLALVPDHLYLWKEGYPSAPDRAPDYEINAPEVLQAYFDQLALPPHQVSEKQMEAIIASWLKDVAEAEPSADASLKWFYESGLYDALKDGLVEIQDKIAA